MLQAYFRPELLNRLDETVVFRQLSRHNIRQIAGLVLADTASQLLKQNIQLRVSPAVMAKVVEEGYDEVCVSFCCTYTWTLLLFSCPVLVPHHAVEDLCTY